ncbi:MAG: PAS domain S-box protein [Deltaproteobacteria bacterium]|nr:PAS domain S-box protein [Deltaproteobacteria bacterium]
MIFFSQWLLEPQLVVVYPIISITSGKANGYLFAELSLKNFFNRMPREHSGKSNLFMVNMKGEVVAHTNLNHVLQSSRVDQFPPVDKVRQGADYALGEYVNLEGKTVLGVVVRVEGLPLMVVSETPLREVFLFVRQMRSRFYLILVMTLILILIGSWYLSRSMTRAIGRLYKAAEKIRDGRLEPVEGDFPDDEIGFFANCFNQMVASLKEDRELREKAEAELRESEKRYRTIADYSYDMECWRDENGKFIHISPSCENVTGYSPQEFYDNYLLMNEIVIEEDRKIFIGHRHEVSNDGVYKPIEFRIRHKDGTIRWLSHICRQVIGPDGENLGNRGSNRDITSRKLAESFLEVEKERLQVTLRSIGDGVITTDNQGSVTLLNPVAEQLTGWKNDAASGRSIDEVFPLCHERTREPLDNPVKVALSENRVVDLSNHTLLLSRNGEEIAIADSAAPIVSQDGRRFGAVLVFRDVRSEKRLQLERLRSEKLEAVGVLAGGIAHDFNNLLMGLQGSIDLLRLSCRKGPEAMEKHFLSAESAINRAVSLARQFLTFAKGGDPVKEKTSLPQLVEESAEFVLHGTQVKLELEVEEGIWDVEVDSGQISQVVNNLVTNARQAMDDCGIIRIRIENCLLNDREAAALNLHAGHYVKVSVADEGPGIDAEIIHKIFEPYFTTKKTGSGLGLATSYSIIDNHEGYFGVSSEPGKGAVFTFYLPSVGSAEVASGVRARGGRALTGADLNGMRILLMDDEQVIRDVVTEMLNILGCEVVSVRDGEELLAYYRKTLDRGESFQVIIMDLSIPGGMGGREAIKKLRELDDKVKVIVSSGYSQDPVMAEFKSFGFDGMVAKPYRIGALLAVLKEIGILPEDQE